MARREIYQQNWDVPCCFGPSTLGPGYLDGDHGSTDCFTRPVNTVTWAPSCGGFPYLFIYDYFLSFQLTQWTWVWVNSRSWWWTGRPSVPQSMGSQRVGHDWVTELNIYTSFYQVLGFKITAKNSQWTFWGVVIITRKDGNNMNTQYTQHVIFALLLFRKGY